MQPDPPTTGEIRAAIVLLHQAVNDADTTLDPASVNTAHSTLTRARRTSGPPVDRWLADYLHHDVWHSGPQPLAAAIDELAAHFKLPQPVRTGPPDGNQGTLF